MRGIGLLTGVVLVMLPAGMVACRSTPSRPSAPAGSIVVFAAASLKPAFSKMATEFSAENPGAAVDFDYAGSSDLANQLTQGATADVFASADTKQMDKVAKAGLLAGGPANFASNTLVIVTPPGNPKNIASFGDLASPGLERGDLPAAGAVRGGHTTGRGRTPRCVHPGQRGTEGHRRPHQGHQRAGRRRARVRHRCDRRG